MILSLRPYSQLHLYGYTRHVNPNNLCSVFQCKLINFLSCLVKINLLNLLFITVTHLNVLREIANKFRLMLCTLKTKMKFQAFIIGIYQILNIYNFTYVLYLKKHLNKLQLLIIFYLPLPATGASQ